MDTTTGMIDNRNDMSKSRRNTDNQIFLASYPESRAAKSAAKNLTMILRLSTLEIRCTKVAVISKNAKRKIQITEYEGTSNNKDDSTSKRLGRGRRPRAAAAAGAPNCYGFLYLPIAVVTILVFGEIIIGLLGTVVAALLQSSASCQRVVAQGCHIGLLVGVFIVLCRVFGFASSTTATSGAAGSTVKQYGRSLRRCTSVLNCITTSGSTMEILTILADCLEPESSLLVAFFGGEDDQDEEKLVVKTSEIRQVYKELTTTTSSGGDDVLRTAVLRLG